MEKRLLLAIVMSLLVVSVWSGVMSKMHPIVNKEVIEKKSLPDLEEEVPISLATKEIGNGISLENIQIENQEFIFSLPYAILKEVYFKDYQNHKFSLQRGFWIKDKNIVFQIKRLGAEPTFIYEDKEKRIIKRFIFYKNNNSIGLDIAIQNISNRVLDLDFPLILATVDLSGGQLEGRFQEVVLRQGDKTIRLNLRRDFSSDEDIKFLALKDRYFCAIIEPYQVGFRGFIKKFNNKEAEVGLVYRNKISPGKEINLDFVVYIGPQKPDKLENINKDWSSIINYGMFDSISRLLLKLLGFFHNMVQNWGLAIIMLSLAIYIILYPLTFKQMRSMKRMQDLQPKIEELRRFYKDNPQKLNKEILELYRKEKANPFSGCLPMILQIPIFFALYQSLMRSVELKGANFMWIKDLSEPDRIYVFANKLPVIGNEINILPILMMVVMFLQQKSSTTATAGSSQEQQRLMMILFPLLFGVIFYHMPSGLVLYWFINTLLMFINQSRIKLHH